MIVLHKPESVFSFRHAPSWVLLTMAAGSVNAGTFLACQRFVTHLTGTATRIGMDVGRASPLVEYGFVVVCFVVGAMTSVLAIDARSHRGLKPLYALPLLVVAGVVALVGVLGAHGVFGVFGGSVDEPPSSPMLSLLAFALGLQNAAVATSTGQVVRTTHLTGPATDLGIHLGTVLFTRGARRRDALKQALLRGGKIVGFVTGAALMVPAATRFEFLAFVLPASLVLCATALSFVPSWTAVEVPRPGRVSEA